MGRGMWLSGSRVSVAKWAVEPCCQTTKHPTASDFARLTDMSPESAH